VNQDDEPGFTLHFGCVVVVMVILAAIAVVWWLPGRITLWVAGSIVVVVVGAPVVMTLFESRWFLVTAEDRDRGVPGTCPHCHEELTAVIGKRRYTVRCGFCGYRKKGQARLIGS